MEVMDKHQTRGVSINVEVFDLKRILERMVGKIIISESPHKTTGSPDKIPKTQKFAKTKLVSHNFFQI